MNNRADQQLKFPLGELPVDVIELAFFDLAPEEISRLARVNKNFYLAAQSPRLWKHKLKQHFPEQFEILEKNKFDQSKFHDWRRKFIEIYNDEYRNLPLAIKELFSLEKEKKSLDQKIEELKTKLQLADLDRCDKYGISILDWAKKNDQQALLDYFYQLAKEKYTLHVPNKKRFLQRFFAGFYQHFIKKNPLHFTQSTDKKDKNNNTLLHWAVLCQQPVATINSLIAQGADVNAQTIEGATPLLFAIENENFTLVDALLAHHADFMTLQLHTNSPYHKKFTVLAGDCALQAAIRKNNVAIIDTLLDKLLPNINTLTLKGSNALHIAAIEGRTNIIEKLLTKYHAEINCNSKGFASALLFAVEGGHEETVNLLLKNNAELSQRLGTDNSYHSDFNVLKGDTPLHAAIKLGHTKIVAALLNKSNNVHEMLSQETIKGFDALHLASMNGHTSIVKLIISHGFDINSLSASGESALFLACKNGHADIVDVLLKNNANTSLADPSGDTPLHIAARNENANIMRKLLAKNANPLAHNNQKQKPIDVAPNKLLFTSQLQLLTYLAEKNIQHKDHKKSFSLFGRKFLDKPFSIFGHTFNLSRDKKVKAAKALKEVFLEGKNKSCLSEHYAALHNGKLSNIYRDLKHTSHNSRTLKP